MIKSSIEKMADPIGFDIGNSDDVTQANLINGFARALKKLSDMDLNMQMCYIADHLTNDACNVIATLCQFTDEKSS